MGITHNEPVVAQGVLVLEEVLQIYIFETNSFCVFYNISPSARGVVGPLKGDKQNLYNLNL